MSIQYFEIMIFLCIESLMEFAFEINFGSFIKMFTQLHTLFCRHLHRTVFLSRVPSNFPILLSWQTLRYLPFDVKIRELSFTMWGGGWRKFSEKVTSYYDPPPAPAAPVLILWPPLPDYYDPPFKIFCRLPSIRKGNKCTLYAKKPAAGANFGKFSFISPLNGCI